MRTKVALKLPAGVSKNASPSMDTARWYDTNLVRWVSGRLQPFGGYVDTGITGFASPIRRLFTWSDNSATVRTAVLCEKNLYVIVGGTLYDITPVGGITGPVSGSPLGGYGDGIFGEGTYGTPRAPQPGRTVAGNAYTLSNFGEQLLAMSSADGRLLMWDPTKGTSTLATEVNNAPEGGRTFVVTPERYVIMFGYGGDYRKFGWCNQENITDWNTSEVTGTAGEYEVEPGAPTSSAISAKQGTVFFTGVAAYLISYAGPPYIYTYEMLAADCAPVSAQCVVRYGNSIVWMADNGMWVFDGSSVQPLPCDMFDWYKQTVNHDTARDNMFGINIGKYPEILWFFPSKSGGVPDRYMLWNYADNWWANGSLSRQAGVPSRYAEYPLLADAYHIYTHEKGTSFAGGDIAYALSPSLSVGSGRTSMLLQMLPDNKSGDGDPMFSVYGRYDRVGSRDLSSADESAEGLLSKDGYVDVRLTARDFQFKVYSPDSSTNDWDFGEAMLDIRPRGAR